MSDMWSLPSCSSPSITHQVVRNHGNHHFTQGPDLENPNWIQPQPSQFPSMPSSYTYFDQNQDQNHLDLHLPTHIQTQFGSVLSCDPLQSEVFCFPDPQCLLSAGPDLDPFAPLVPAQTQEQSSGLGLASGGVDPFRWRSTQFSSGLSDNFYSALSEFYPNSYHDDGATQPFCSPSTPGPSPHYPQTPFVSNPGPQISSAFLTQDTLHFPMTSDPICCDLPQIQDQAELRWSESRGQEDWTRMHDGSVGSGAADSRLLCSVCNRDFRSLPVLNSHMRPHGSCQLASRTNQNQDTPPPMSLPAPTPAPVSVVMPVSVPVRSKRGNVQRRRSHAAPAGNALLYSSHMRCLISEEEGGRAGHYTPCPMLSPLRAGPGLYWSLNTTTIGQPRPWRPPAHGKKKDDSSRTMFYDGSSCSITTETAQPPLGTLMSGINTPRINIGRDFQAEIPPLLDLKYVHSDSHNAMLLWAPWAELECAANKQRVEAMLMLTRSSVVPGGRANPEYVLQLLSQSRGDFLVTLEKLLSNPEPNNIKQRGGLWSPSESRSLVQSLQLHQKDFISVQRDVQTKTLPQCVEFYYLWKKKLNLRIRSQTRLTVALPNASTGPQPGPRPGPGPRRGFRPGATSSMSKGNGSCCFQIDTDQEDGKDGGGDGGRTKKTPPEMVMDAEDETTDALPGTQTKQKTSKDVHFSFLPEKYEPLIEDEDEGETKETRRREQKKKRKRRYKKYRKNVGKALRFTWRCLVAGLQNMMSAYSSPVAAAVSVATAAHKA